MNSNPITSQLLGKSKSDKTTTGFLSVQLFGKPKDDKKKKTPPKIHNYESFSEPISELKNDLEKNISKTAEKAVSETWKQLLGVNKPLSPFSGNLQPGQELDIDAIKQQQEQAANENAKAHNIEPGINYVGEVLHGREKTTRENSQKTQAQIQELISEIQKIGATVKELNQQATEATQGAVQTQERYHKGFLQWVLSMFEDTRDRIEDSDNWLQTSQGKKNLKGKIGTPVKQKAKTQQLIKKHGTKFSQSGERTAGTSSG